MRLPSVWNICVLHLLRDAITYIHESGRRLVTADLSTPSECYIDGALAPQLTVTGSYLDFATAQCLRFAKPASWPSLHTLLVSLPFSNS